MRPFLQKRLIDLLPSSRSGADAAGGDGEPGTGEGGAGGSKKRKAAKGGGDSDAEGEEEDDEAATAAAAAAGGAASQLKGCDVFSALLKVGGHQHCSERAAVRWVQAAAAIQVWW